MKLLNIFEHLKTILYYRLLFRKIDYKALIIKPIKLDNTYSIEIGKSTFIAHQSWLMGSTSKKEKGLIIGDNTTIGHFAHIIATKEVIIENNVLIADKVFISDCTHNYQDAYTPIKDQGISFICPVHIGEGSWLGENVCVCGANIGRHCVIGANSVVTKDIPDYCVAIGAPAKIIKKYDEKKKKWISV